MASYQIVCTERQASHGHITHVGTGSDPADQRWTVKNVREAIEDGDTFYTVGPRSGKTAYVEPYDAYANGVILETIRSSADAVEDNNLDNLRACSWKS